MKKRTIILLIILVAIIFTVGVAAYKYHDYISIIYKAATTSTEELQENKQETDQKAIDAIKEYGISTVRPLTEEESAKLNSGEMTEEEAVNLVLGQLNDEKSTETEVTQEQGVSDGNTVSNSNEHTLKEKNAEIAQLVGKIYVLKAKFTGELDAVERWVHSEYNKLTPEEKKSKSAKVRIGRQAYSKALALEADCDGQMEEILNRLTVLLKETNQSTALVDEIRTAYENEKTVKISYYMDKI